MLREYGLCEATLQQLPSCVMVKQCEEYKSRFEFVNTAAANAYGFDHSDQVYGLYDEELNCESAQLWRVFHQQDQLTISQQRQLKTLDIFEYGKFGFSAIIADRKALSGMYTMHQDAVLITASIIDTKYISKVLSMQCGLPRCVSGSPKGAYVIDSSYHEAELSQRESECYFYTLRGRTAGEIATLLNISKRTVETHIVNIKNKLGISTKAELFDYAYVNGLLYTLIESLI